MLILVKQNCGEGRKGKIAPYLWLGASKGLVLPEMVMLLLWEGHRGVPQGHQTGPEQLPLAGAQTPSDGPGECCLANKKAAMFGFFSSVKCSGKCNLLMREIQRSLSPNLGKFE